MTTKNSQFVMILSMTLTGCDWLNDPHYEYFPGETTIELSYPLNAPTNEVVSADLDQDSKRFIRIEASSQNITHCGGFLRTMSLLENNNSVQVTSMRVDTNLTVAIVVENISSGFNYERMRVCQLISVTDANGVEQLVENSECDAPTSFADQYTVDQSHYYKVTLTDAFESLTTGSYRLSYKGVPESIVNSNKACPLYLDLSVS